MTERRVLGRGLRALIPETASVGGGEASVLPIGKIRSNPKQPREFFDPEALKTLAQSIRKSGVVQPILVRPKEDLYEIVCGERRFRAAQEAGLADIPAVVRAMSEEEALECSIVENVQRNDLNPIEEGHAYQRLVREFGMTQEKVAEVIGKDRSTVANTIRLLTLPKPIQEYLIHGKLTMGHARALLAVTGEEEQWKLCQKILASSLSVRETERVGRSPQRGKAARGDETVRHVEEELQKSLGTKVRITDRKGKGKIILEYYSPPERERLVRLLKGRMQESS